MGTLILWIGSYVNISPSSGLIITKYDLQQLRSFMQCLVQTRLSSPATFFSEVRVGRKSSWPWAWSCSLRDCFQSKTGKAQLFLWFCTWQILFQLLHNPSLMSFTLLVCLTLLFYRPDVDCLSTRENFFWTNLGNDWFYTKRHFFPSRFVCQCERCSLMHISCCLYKILGWCLG